ncbi:hypothetical protein CBQ28_19080 [Pseudoalteromonas sp. GCY]|nr:hypothetical protein CBQ28_19080 [Pseudoalteromonas sp. GCY]
MALRLSTLQTHKKAVASAPLSVVVHIEIMKMPALAGNHNLVEPLLGINLAEVVIHISEGFAK